MQCILSPSPNRLSEQTPLSPIYTVTKPVNQPQRTILLMNVKFITVQNPFGILKGASALGPYILLQNPFIH